MFRLRNGPDGVVRCATAILSGALVKQQGEKPVQEIEPYAGIGKKERIKRPAFLLGIRISHLRRM
jgi:hypothetical protein